MGEGIARSFAAQGAPVSFVDLLDTPMPSSRASVKGTRNPMTSQSW
jgi:hypothetical protein